MKCLIDKKNALPLNADIALTESSMYKLPRPHLGQVVCTTDTYKTYIYKEDGWTELGNVKVEGKGLEMSLYNLNQSIITQLPEIIDFTSSIDIINQFYDNTDNEYYMLYAKDISYFTIFNIRKYGEFAHLGDGVIACLQQLGAVKNIDYTEAKDAIEIWFQQNDNDPVCAYLFPYDRGIVTIEKE